MLFVGKKGEVVFQEKRVKLFVWEKGQGVVREKDEVACQGNGSNCLSGIRVNELSGKRMKLLVREKGQVDYLGKG